MFVKTIIKQGEKIIKLDKEKEKLEKKNYKLALEKVDLSRENLNLTGMIDDMQEEVLFILDNIEEYLTSNSYNNNEAKIRKTLEYVREQKDIIEKDLDKNNELAYDYQSKN